MMPLIYIAGPYSDPDRIHGIERNINEASRIALEGDIEMLKRCDAILMIPGWQRSKGAMNELQIVLHAGLLALYYEEVEGVLPSPAEVL